MNQDEHKKKRCTVWLSEEAVRKSDTAVTEEELSNRSGCIERAIHFYSGYLAAQRHEDFLADTITKAVEGTVRTTENRISKLLFKIAVEMAKLEQMLASINEMDEETMRRLHIRCVNEVKKINGIIKMEDAVRYQRSEEE